MNQTYATAAFVHYCNLLQKCSIKSIEFQQRLKPFAATVKAKMSFLSSKPDKSLFIYAYKGKMSKMLHGMQETTIRILLFIASSIFFSDFIWQINTRLYNILQLYFHKAKILLSVPKYNFVYFVWDYTR